MPVKTDPLVRLLAWVVQEKKEIDTLVSTYKSQGRYGLAYEHRCISKVLGKFKKRINQEIYNANRKEQ